MPEKMILESPTQCCLQQSPNRQNNNQHQQCVVFVRTSSTARIPLYQHLAALGYHLVMIHPSKEPLPDFAASFEHWISCETNDVNVLETHLRAAMKDHEFTPDAIVSFDEYGVYPAAQLCQRFNKRPLPMGPEALRNTTVKSAFREWCMKHKIGCPKFAKLMTPADDLDSTLQGITFPCVIKPSPGAGSMLTMRVETMEELRATVPSLWASLENHPALVHLEALGIKVHLLVEEFVGGQEVDIDCVVENGVVRFCAISDNFEVKPPYFCEQGGLCPSALGRQEQKQLRSLLDDFVRTYGSEIHGVLHFEAKYDFQRQAAFTIEVNVRPGSAETHTMVSTVYGVQLGECLVRLALGDTLDDLDLENQKPIGYAASVNIYPDHEGIISKLELPASVSPSLVKFCPMPVGSSVAPPPQSFGLMAWMVATGATPEAARTNIDNLTSSVEFELCDAHVPKGKTTAEKLENASFASSPFATSPI